MHTLTKYFAVLSLILTTSFAFAESDPHTQESLKHLDQAEESAETGDFVNASKHTAQAKQQAIMHAAKHPLHKSANSTSKEKLRRGHADEVFENMDNVNSSIEKGDKQATVKAIDETEKHLKHEQQIDVDMK
jgi:hypothetical protein